jgi:hypothetical protein
VGLPCDQDGDIGAASAGGSGAEVELERAAGSTGASGSDRRRRRGWFGWSKSVWRSAMLPLAATYRVVGLVPRSLRRSRSGSRESAPAGVEEGGAAAAAAEPRTPRLAWGGGRKRTAAARTATRGGDSGAWLKRLSLTTPKRTSSSKAPATLHASTAAPEVVKKGPGGLQQVHEIVGLANHALQELHEVVKIDRVQRFLPDLSKKQQRESIHGGEAVLLDGDGRPLPRVNALQQVTHLTENIRRAVTDLRSTAQHLESLDDRMRDRMQEMQNPAWRRSLRKILLYVVLYTSVTFALIYIIRHTIKVGMIPVLESLFYSKQLLSQVSELRGDAPPGCDASMDDLDYYELKDEL